jgi:endonuclease YncB( thermonuclease family)
LPREPELVGPPDRNVTPAGVTPGPRAVGLMLRVPAEVPDPPPSPEPETTYRRVVVLDGGSFRAIADGGPVVVRLAGVAAPEFTATCTDADGRSWKCGARARAELARLILNRSVACVIVDESVPEEPTARCRVGLFDLADWLVRRGWADPAEDAGPELVEAGREARSNRRGRFGPAPMGIIAG